MHKQDIKSFLLYQYRQFSGVIHKINKKWFSIFSALFALPFAIYKIYQDSHTKAKHSKHIGFALALDIKNLCLALVDVVLAVASFVVVGPCIYLIGTCKDVINSCLDAAVSIYQRFMRRTQKNIVIDNLTNAIKIDLHQHQQPQKSQVKALVKHLNQQHRQNIEIFNTAQKTILSSLTLLGLALTLSPAAPIGAALLTATTVYTFLDAIGINPLRWLMQTINNFLHGPFSVVREKHLLNTLSGTRAQPPALISRHPAITVKQQDGVHHASSRKHIYQQLSSGDHQRSQLIARAHQTHHHASNKKARTFVDKERAIAKHAMAQLENDTNVLMPSSDHLQVATCSK